MKRVLIAIIALIIAGGLGLLLFRLRQAKGPGDTNPISAPTLSSAPSAKVLATPTHMPAHPGQRPTSVVVKESLNFEKIQDQFQKKHPDKKFRLSRDFNSLWGQLKGDELDDYRGLPILEASQRFLEDHPELIADLPPGAEIGDMEVKETPAGYGVVLRTSFEGGQLPGNKTLFFRKDGENAGAFYSMNNSTPPVRNIRRCTQISAQEAQQFLVKHYQEAVFIKRIVKEWNSASDATITEVWAIDYSVKTDEGAKNYLAKISACQLRFSDGGTPRGTDQH